MSVKSACLNPVFFSFHLMPLKSVLKLPLPLLGRLYDWGGFLHMEHGFCLSNWADLCHWSGGDGREWWWRPEEKGSLLGKQTPAVQD